jgi:hypothetical protein
MAEVADHHLQQFNIWNLAQSPSKYRPPCTQDGTDVNDISNWHATMTRLRIDPLPDTVLGSKKVRFLVSAQAEPWSKEPSHWATAKRTCSWC